MALKEGRCVNCGSLLYLDPEMPKGHCLFCDCVFDNEDAFRANENPESFTFPNEKQPRYEGPSLTPGRARRGSAVPAPSVVPTPVEKKEDSYQLPEMKIPDLKIPVKAVVLYSALTLLILGISVAVAFPLLGKRNQRQEEVADKFAKALDYAIDKEKDIRVQEMTATEVVVILPQDISAQESIDLFNLYCQIRADVVELKDSSFESEKKPVTLRIATPGGGYLIDRPEDEASLRPGALTPLN
ncbi:MAG: hypothetical protein GX838_06260 [Clostridiaceae bacterium]|nr:hypothetical protein [Clostridiaceae bacterium]